MKMVIILSIALTGASVQALSGFGKLLFENSVVKSALKESQKFFSNPPKYLMRESSSGIAELYAKLSLKYDIGVKIHEKSKKIKMLKVLTFLDSLDGDQRIASLFRKAVIDPTIELGKWEQETLMKRGLAYVALLQFDPRNRKLAEKAFINFNAVLERDDENIRAYFYRGLINTYFHRGNAALSDFHEANMLINARKEFKLISRPGPAKVEIARTTIKKILTQEEQNSLFVRALDPRKEEEFAFGSYDSGQRLALVKAADEMNLRHITSADKKELDKLENLGFSFKDAAMIIAENRQLENLSYSGFPVEEASKLIKDRELLALRMSLFKISASENSKINKITQRINQKIDWHIGDALSNKSLKVTMSIDTDIDTPAGKVVNINLDAQGHGLTLTLKTDPSQKEDNYMRMTGEYFVSMLKEAMRK